MRYQKTFLVFSLWCMLATAFIPIHYTHSQNDNTVANPGNNDNTIVDQLGANGGGGGSLSIQNPLGEGSTITSFFLQIIEILLIFAIPIIVIFIIISGFRMVTAQGDTKQLEDSKRAFIYAIIGGLLILGANVILQVIQGTVDGFMA